MRLGLTLPSFRREPDVPLAVARAAETAGLDGIFAYDHLFRVALDGAHRPALECTALLAACAAETDRITLGSLVARATLRPPALLVNAFRSLRVIAGDRILLAVGAGDEESRAEMDEFGVEFGDEHHRVEALAATVGAACTAGCAPVWVGGTARHVGHVAAQADGWNRWGASADRFAQELESVTQHVEEAKREAFVPSWGGLVVLGEDEAAAEKKAIRLTAPPTALVGGPERVAERFLAYGAAGARWVVAGPVDSSDPENAAILGELVAPLVRGA